MPTCRASPCPRSPSPTWRPLVDSVNESSSISVLDDIEIVYVARVPTRRIMSITLSVGTRLPAYATSMGRVLLARCPRPSCEARLARIDVRAALDAHHLDQRRAADRPGPGAQAGLGGRRSGAGGGAALAGGADPGRLRGGGGSAQRLRPRQPRLDDDPAPRFPAPRPAGRRRDRGRSAPGGRCRPPRPLGGCGGRPSRGLMADLASQAAQHERQVAVSEVDHSSSAPSGRHNEEC